MEKLKIISNQIYNSSNDWMQGVLIKNDKKYLVSYIPPRSTRPLPIYLQNSSIFSESILSPNIVQNIGSLSLNFQLINPLNENLVLNGDGDWHGSFNYEDKKEDIKVTISIRENQIQGFFCTDNYFYFSGGINSQEKSGHILLYNEVTYEIYDLTCQFQQIGQKYILIFQNPSIVLNCTIKNDLLKIPQKSSDSNEPSINEIISGHYREFLENTESSSENHLNFEVSSNFLVRAVGIGENKTFSMEGYINISKNSFFFIQHKKSGIVFYMGQASLQNSIFFSGIWTQGDDSGNVTFIKSLPNK